MQTENKTLIAELTYLLDEATAKVQRFKTMDAAQLNFKNNHDQWSALECIEHLNLYGDYYLPEIERRILAQLPADNVPAFKSGIIGDYFARLMKTENGQVKKMKTTKDKNPVNSALSATTLDRFLKQQERLKMLLQQAQQIDLTRTKTSISLTPLIKLRLGDTFRFMTYHIERHVFQAERTADR